MNEPDNKVIEEVWSQFCEDLKQAGKQLSRPTTPADPLTLAEGIRHLSRLLRIGLESNVEFSDSDFPVISKMVDETKKFGCDNPDTMYMKANVNGAYQYRITGKRGTVDYLSFITSSKDPETNQFERFGFIDTNSLLVEADGSFEILLSAEQAPGNWLKLGDDEMGGLSIRQTFLNRDTEEPAELAIERIDQSDAPASLTLETIQAQLQSASNFVNYCTSLFPDWTEGYQAHPNKLPPADQEACLRAGGDPNIYFYRSFWQLAPDEALVIYIPRIPECDTWNLQVDNYWQESMDYRYYRSRVNKHTAAYNDDGSVTIVIAHSNPDHKNWLETAGHALGHFAMRYIHASEHIDPLTCACKHSEISQTIASMEQA